MDATLVKQRLSRLLKGDFFKNVLTVATGTASAQAVTLAFTPIATRLYGPEAFGLQGVFLSVVTLLATGAALGYPTAIVLPKGDAQAKAIGRLSIYAGAGVCIAVALTFAVASDYLLAVLNAEAIGGFVQLIPVMMFVSVISAVQGSWLIRKRAFAFSARYGVYSALALNVFKTGMGFVTPSALMLIVSNLVGSVAGVFLTALGWRKARSTTRDEASEVESEKVSLRALALEHKDFPLLRTPQNLINAFSRSLPIILLSTYFGATAAGQYSLALSVLVKPASLIGGSVMSVFYPRINEAIHKGEDAKRLIVKATLAMAATGVAPFLALIVLGPLAFRIIFGEEWGVAGEYAQWLSGWIFFQYINRPAVSAIPALRLQGGLLVYELLSTGTKILGLWLGFAVFESALVAVALFSVFGIIAYAWLILWVIRRSPGPAVGH